jgi:MFS family permease
MKNESSLKSWLVVMSAASFFFYSFIQMTIFSTAEMKDYFSAVLSIPDTASFGVFAGMFLNGCVLFLIPAGILLDKFSVKKLILASVLLMLAGVIGLTFTQNLGMAKFFRFISGVAHCIAFMAPLRLAPRWFPSNKLALAVGLVITFAVTGGLISQTPMFLALNAFGGKQTMLMNIGLGIVVFILILLVVKDHPKGYVKTVASQSLPLLTGLKNAIANKQNWLSGFYIGLLNLSVLLLGAIWGTNYLLFKYDQLSAQTITSVIGMIFIGTMIGSPLCGLISDKLKNRKLTMMAGAFLSLLIMLIIMFASNPSSGFLYIMFLLLGIFTSAQTIGYAVIAESNNDNVLGTANGFAAVLLMGMAAIAQPLFGWLINLFGGETSTSYMKAIYLMPVSFLIALICALLLRETFKLSR